MISDGPDDYLYKDPEHDTYKFNILTLLVPQLTNLKIYDNEDNISFVFRGSFSSQSDVNERISELNEYDELNKVTLATGEWLAYENIETNDPNMAFSDEASRKLNDNIRMLYDIISRDKIRTEKRIEEEKEKEKSDKKTEKRTEEESNVYDIDVSINTEINKEENTKEKNNSESSDDANDADNSNVDNAKSDDIDNVKNKKLCEKKFKFKDPYIPKQEVAIVSIMTKHTILKLDESYSDKVHDVRGLKIRAICNESEVEDMIKTLAMIDQTMEFFPAKFCEIISWTDCVPDIQEYVSPLDKIAEYNLPNFRTKKEADIYTKKCNEIEKERTRMKNRKLQEQKNLREILSDVVGEYDEVKMAKIIGNLIEETLKSKLDNDGSIKQKTNIDKFKEVNKISKEYVEKEERLKKQTEDNIKMIKEERERREEELKRMEQEIEEAKRRIKNFNKKN